MNSYYYLNAAGQQSGPTTKDNLINVGVTKDTYVWCKGMRNWEKAGDVQELKPLFNTYNNPPVPPVTPVQSPSTPYNPNFAGNQCPQNYMIPAILSTLLCCLPTGIAAIIYSSKVEKLWAQGDKAGAINSSEQAKTWCIISLGLGIVSFIIGFIGGFLG